MQVVVAVEAVATMVAEAGLSQEAVEDPAGRPVPLSLTEKE